jgi:hypothetical protein
MVISSKGSPDRDSETEISDTLWPARLVAKADSYQMGPDIQFYNQTRL